MNNKRKEIQSEALQVSIKNKRCGLAISMGVGKTLIGLNYIDHFQKANMGKLNILIVTPKLSIFDSWKSDAEKFNINIDNVNFTTYLSINKWNPHAYDLLILDECHSLLNSHLTFLKLYTGRILGLTGTPPRYNNSEKGALINEYCPINYEYITDEAVEDNILNDYKIVVHYINLSSKNDIPVQTKSKTFYTSELNNYNYWSKRVQQAGTPKEKQMTSIMRMKSMMTYTSKEQYVSNLLKNTNDKTLIFCNTQAQADKMCKYSYHSGNNCSDNNLILFKEGLINKMSCVLQLNEGINIPDLKTGIILHAYSGSSPKMKQRFGRLLRLNSEDVSTTHIICYKDTIDEKWVADSLSDLEPSKIKYVYE